MKIAASAYQPPRKDKFLIDSSTALGMTMRIAALLLMLTWNWWGRATTLLLLFIKFIVFGYLFNILKML